MLTSTTIVVSKASIWSLWSHILPIEHCDLTVFRPLKNALHKECQTITNMNNYESLTLLNFIPLFYKSLSQNCQSGKSCKRFQICRHLFRLNYFWKEGSYEQSQDLISPEEAVNVIKDIR